MKKFIIAIVLAIIPLGVTFAGENPKLFKEISRKIKVDLSGLKLDKSQDNYVIVYFRVVNQEISVVDSQGTEEQLTELMMCELEEMFINTEANSSTIYQYKFTFEKE